LEESIVSKIKTKPCIEDLENKVRNYKLKASRSELHFTELFLNQEETFKENIKNLQAENTMLRAMLEKPAINFN